MATEALLDWGLHSDRVVDLLAMICAHESHGGEYRRQIGGGSALGIFQIEPPTHDSVWDNCDSIRARAGRYGVKRDLSQLEHSDRYSVFVARHYLLMDPAPLPVGLVAQAAYCKAYWNRTGKATPDKYLADLQLWKDSRL